MHIHNRNLNIKSLKEIYLKGENYLRAYNQWKRCQHWEHVNKYYYKLEAVTEMLENFIVFNIGDGMDNFKSFSKHKNVEERFLSFKSFLYFPD